MTPFKYDNPVFEYLNMAAQYIALNLIFVACCITVITAGPAFAALSQVTMREARDEHGYIIKGYFRAFKEMFVQAGLTFLLIGAMFAVGAYAGIFWFTLDTTFGTAAAVISAIFCVILLNIGLYVFPLMARFDNNFWQTLKNAFFMSCIHAKTTMILLLILAAVVSVVCLFEPMRIFMVVVGFSFYGYCVSFIYNRLFKEYETGAAQPEVSE